LCGYYISNENFEDFEDFSETLSFSGLNFTPYDESTDLQFFFENDIDILIVQNNFEFSIKNITKFVKSKSSYEVALDKKVKKILLAKSWTGLQKTKQPNSYILKKELNSGQSYLATRYLCENSIILFRNNDSLIPLIDLENNSIELITLGKEKLNDLEVYLKKYSPVSSKFISIEENKYYEKVKNEPNHNTVIVAINDFSPDTSLINSLKKITINNLIILNFGDINNLEYFKDFSTVIHSFSNSEFSQEYMAQLVFGGIEAQGIIPYNISDNLKFGFGLKTIKTRLKYTIPEEVGINSEYLENIDSIVACAIYGGATPGCQVYIAKDGKVIYNKSFGYHTYSKSIAVKENDLYDIASITKVAATTLASMKMYEQGKLSLDKEIGKYFKDTHIEYTRIKPDTIINIDTLELKDIKDMYKLLKVQDTIHLTDSLIIAFDTIIRTATPSLNIFKVTPRELLVHTSGIQPAMPILRFLFYIDYYIADYKREIAKNDTTGIDTSKIIIDRVKIAKDAYNRYYSNKYFEDSSEVQIAAGMYLNKSYWDTLWIDTKQLRNYSRKIFIYSDVNMILLQQTIDTINNYSIDKYLNTFFYNSLGLQSIGFLPLKKYSYSRIIPTENDCYWRGQTLQGYVHDPSAALLGGIAGNAGLFASAQDLGVIFQLLLNGGTYGGERYLQKSTVDMFTQTQPDTHRGLGFDKPYKNTIIAEDASENSWGHTGFTGCCVWVDPDIDLVYVFLSNRVNPSANNWRLNSLQVRQKVHQVIYDAIEEGI
jgi:CubicO group peptidase (beta-lactamase class C family)